MIEFQDRTEDKMNSNLTDNKDNQRTNKNTQINHTANYYNDYMEKVGYSSIAWIMFTLAAFLQFIWGQESCFISINLDFLGDSQNIPHRTKSICICILFSMMGLGAALLGTLTYNFGRILTLEISLLFYLFSSSLCSCLPLPINFFIVVILRCISNVSLSIFNILVINLMCEFFPTRYRCLVLMINSGFYNVGNLYTIVLNNLFLNVDSFNQYQWRNINFVLAIPGIISMIILTIWGYESPLYLLNKDKKEEAFYILEKISGEYLTDLQKENILISISSKKNYKLNSSYYELFNKDYCFLTFCSTLICSICYLNMIGISYLIPKTIQDLRNKIYNISYTMQILIYGVIQLPNGFIGGFMAETSFFGRKKTIWISALMCAIFYFISAFWYKYAAIYAGMIMLFNSISFGCAIIYVTEIYPTNLRDNAQSFIQCFSFLLGSWSPFIVDSLEKKYSNIILAITNLICIGLTLILPVETYQRPLDEDII